MKAAALQSQFVDVYLYRFAFIGGVQHDSFKPEGKFDSVNLRLNFSAHVYNIYINVCPAVNEVKNIKQLLGQVVTITFKFLINYISCSMFNIAFKKTLYVTLQMCWQIIYLYGTINVVLCQVIAQINLFYE